ncbi:MAG: hypothetical protein CL609_04380 [Anaerolineaceae bacterium]|nr:hypothetical protein [Anaerolineaceae bacterium]
MEKEHLYQQIAEKIRNDILDGIIKPGEKLPSVRKLTESWNCTPGTVQRAYKALSDQGLIISRAGQGTRVSAAPDTQPLKSIRKATLINKAEAFLLEALNSGYSQAEIEQSIRLALDHWRVIQQEPEIKGENFIRFAGSNDLAISWMAAHFDKILPGYELTLQFGGSLSGLIKLAENRVDFAGCHLWDEDRQDYNTAYIKRILPGKKIGLVTLAERRLGLILPAGNPHDCHQLEDLIRPEICFVNRQSGSGTRVWLEARLHEANLSPENIRGFANEKNTHNDVARAITAGEGNLGLGLEAAADIYDLDFIPLTTELYELAFFEETYQNPNFKKLIDWFSTSQAKTAFKTLNGYNTKKTGELRWVQ